MNLIDKFESMPFQDVGTFNSIFKSTPIIGHSYDLPVEIKNITHGQRRLVQIGEATVEMELTQSKLTRDFQRHTVEFKPKAKAFKKEAMKLPTAYKQLTGAEFLIYSAVKELGEVCGIMELSRQISLTSKSIYNNLPRLIKLGYVKTERVISTSGDYTKISVDTSV
jgi:DNA-binding MarR family transcriptional regulator